MICDVMAILQRSLLWWIVMMWWWMILHQLQLKRKQHLLHHCTCVTTTHTYRAAWDIPRLNPTCPLERNKQWYYRSLASSHSTFHHFSPPLVEQEAVCLNLTILSHNKSFVTQLLIQPIHKHQARIKSTSITSHASSCCFQGIDKCRSFT